VQIGREGVTLLPNPELTNEIQDGLMTFEKQNFQNETVELDGHTFVNCTFRRCVMVFSGTTEMSLTGCRFEEVEWEFGGPAARVLSFLHAIYQNGRDGEEFVRAIFRNFKKPLPRG
jgi:uncharacterized C2H2 Zn-finger protein